MEFTLVYLIAYCKLVWEFPDTILVSFPSNSSIKFMNSFIIIIVFYTHMRTYLNAWMYIFGSHHFELGTQSWKSLIVLPSAAMGWLPVALHLEVVTHEIFHYPYLYVNLLRTGSTQLVWSLQILSRQPYYWEFVGSTTSLSCPKDTYLAAVILVPRLLQSVFPCTPPILTPSSAFHEV